MLAEGIARCSMLGQLATMAERAARCARQWTASVPPHSLMLHPATSSSAPIDSARHHARGRSFVRYMLVLGIDRLRDQARPRPSQPSAVGELSWPWRAAGYAAGSRSSLGRTRDLPRGHQTLDGDYFARAEIRGSDVNSGAPRRAPQHHVESNLVLGPTARRLARTPSPSSGCDVERSIFSGWVSFRRVPGRPAARPLQSCPGDAIVIRR